MDDFQYRGDRLHCGEAPLADVAEAVGTPCYVYSAATFDRHLAAVDEAWGDYPHLVCYSVKSASNLALLARAARRGLGADVVSGGELFRALKAGIEPGRIVFSGVGKTAREMAEALDAGILMFNVESAPELGLLAEVAGDRGRRAPVSLRVNPDVDPKTHKYVATGLKESKFGVPSAEAADLYVRAASIPGLEVVGLDCHIGSQLTDVAPFVEAAGRLSALLAELRARGIAVRYLDLGGGLGISYDREDPPSPRAHAEAVLAALGRPPDLTVVVEPGRVVAGNSAVLLTRVIRIKRTPHKLFVVVDAAMNDLLRPSLYGAFHAVWPERSRPGSAALAPADVVGPVCESGDFLAKDRLMPEVAAGELLAVKSAGAYGFSMSSNYNSRPRPAEVLVEGASWRVIRAREDYADLVRGESVD